MAGKRLSMRKTREIIRLGSTTQLSDRQIASACNASPTTVGKVLKAVRDAGLAWPLPEEFSDSELEKHLCADSPAPPAGRPLPDMDYVARELKRKHVTLQLLWEEFHREHPDTYSYSRFCELFREWRGTQDPVMRSEHCAGDKLFVDWAGTTIPYSDGRGNRHEAHLFVAVLGASNYTYAAVFPDEKLGSWLRGHVQAFEFFGGVPAAVVPDNTKTAVTRPCRYDPDLNPAYQELAAHYETAVLPARVRKPRDKAKVENGVQNAGRRIVAALRDVQFTSFAQVALSLQEKLVELNERPFSKMAGCRRSLFLEIEKEQLKPLPQRAFSMGEWRKATVYKDYHIQVQKLFFSVPYTYIGSEVDVRMNDRTLEVYHDGCRIAVHPRTPSNGRCSTLDEHRPPEHVAIISRSAEQFIERAGRIGGNCCTAVRALLQRFPHPEMGFRSCEGLIRLGRQYGEKRLEQACMRALETDTVRYSHIANMLKNRMEDVYVPFDDPPSVRNRNVRGRSYYAGRRAR